MLAKPFSWTSVCKLLTGFIVLVCIAAAPLRVSNDHVEGKARTLEFASTLLEVGKSRWAAEAQAQLAVVAMPETGTASVAAVAQDPPPIQLTSGGATNCPASNTSCPQQLTVCPTQATHCPVQSTVCVTTQCPANTTACPEVATTCQMTVCPAISTSCPVNATVCPAVATHCPYKETQCPATATQCPVVRTSCPSVATQCPVVATTCQYTVCPAIQTKCPVAATVCKVTECPVDYTWCPSVYSSCPLGGPWCPCGGTYQSGPVIGFLPPRLAVESTEASSAAAAQEAPRLAFLR
jgi:hypothetical protein